MRCSAIVTIYPLLTSPNWGVAVNGQQKKHLLSNQQPPLCLGRVGVGLLFYTFGKRDNGKISTVAERCCASIPPSTTRQWPVM